jgi:hypothetical protein
MKELIDKVKDNKICLSYLGLFNDDITTRLIAISEYYIENKTDLGKLKNKVSLLIAECFQNIIRHSGIKDQHSISTENPDFFQIGILEDRVVLSSCNLIDNSHIDSLNEKMMLVNSLSSDELKKLYQEVLVNGSFTEKGGASLGLIEMARKSGLPIKYSFQESSATQSRFFLSLEVSTSKERINAGVDILYHVNFYLDLRDKKVILFYKGDLSKDIIVSLINMLQNNFIDDKKSSSKEKRFMISLIEVLQNISKHGKTIKGSKEGMFCVSMDKGDYIIESANYIEETYRDELEKTLTGIRNMSMESIALLYKERLLDHVITQDGNCGLGLLEIAKNSENRFNYAISQSVEKEWLYSIKIKI